MPKRKNKDDYDYLYKKLKKLEKAIEKSDTTRRRERAISPAYLSENSDGQINTDMEWLGDELPDPLNEEPVAFTSTSPTTVDVATYPAPVVDVISEPTALHSPAKQQSTQLLTASSPPHHEITSPEGAHPKEAQPEENDSDLIEILGPDPTNEKQYGKEANKDVAVRLQHTTTNGLSKEVRKDLLEKYLTPSNCSLINPPTLNEEIKAACSELTLKRDKAIEYKQKTIAAAISCLSEALSSLLSSKEKNTNILKMVMDATKLICDCHHSDSKTRRNFILSALKPDMKIQLQNTKIGKFLFGENLQETIKSAKNINRSGIDLRATAAPKQSIQSRNRPVAPTQQRNLNWKSPLPPRRPMGAPRTRGPVTPAMGPQRGPPLPVPPRQQAYKSSYQRHGPYHR